MIFFIIISRRWYKNFFLKKKKRRKQFFGESNYVMNTYYRIRKIFGLLLLEKPTENWTFFISHDVHFYFFFKLDVLTFFFEVKRHIKRPVEKYLNVFLIVNLGLFQNIPRYTKLWVYYTFLVIKGKISLNWWGFQKKNSYKSRMTNIIQFR